MLRLTNTNRRPTTSSGKSTTSSTATSRMTRQRAVEIARKIETIELLSKGVQAACRKNPADAKRIAGLIYNVGNGKNLPRRISQKQLQQFAAAVDAKKPEKMLRQIVFPLEQKPVKILIPEVTPIANVANTVGKVDAGSSSQQIKSPESGRSKKYNSNQQAKKTAETSAVNQHARRKGTIWAELSREQERQAKQEANNLKLQKRQKQQALRRQLEAQQQEKEAAKQSERQQQQAHSKSITDDVNKWQAEQQEERAALKRKEEALVLDIQGQRQARRQTLERQRKAKAEEERAVVASIEEKKREAAMAEVQRRHYKLAAARAQREENERLQAAKMELERQQKEEAALLGRKYCAEVDAKERARAEALRRKAAAVEAKMRRYEQGHRDIDARAAENERRAAEEQARRAAAAAADESWRIAALHRAARDQREALARQTQVRRQLREQAAAVEAKQAAEFLASERAQQKAREDGEMAQRRAAKLQQSRWLAAQLEEKKRRADNPLAQADISRTELAINRRLLKHVVAATDENSTASRGAGAGIGGIYQEVVLESETGREE